MEPCVCVCVCVCLCVTFLHVRKKKVDVLWIGSIYLIFGLRKVSREPVAFGKCTVIKRPGRITGMKYQSQFNTGNKFSGLSIISLKIACQTMAVPLGKLSLKIENPSWKFQSSDPPCHSSAAWVLLLKKQKSNPTALHMRLLKGSRTWEARAE